MTTFFVWCEGDYVLLPPQVIQEVQYKEYNVMHTSQTVSVISRSKYNKYEWQIIIVLS